MKWIIITILFLLPVLGFAKPAFQDTASKPFDQQSSWAEIKSQAAKEGKYIFVDAFATWCMPCKVMDKTVYPNDSITGLLQKKFVAVKVQMDKTEQDPAYVKSWYNDVEVLRKMYGINAYPTILIFTPEGKIVFNEANSYSVKSLYRIMEYATNPETATMYAALQEYKRNEYGEAVKLFSQKLDSLAFFASRIVKDRGLADSIASEYKDNLIRAGSIEELTNARNMEFIKSFSHLITSADYYFKLCYNSPDKADSVAGSKGWAKFVVTGTIKKEELKDKITSDPSAAAWKRFARNIHRKYNKIDAQKLVLDYQIYYYQSKSNWVEWAHYENIWFDKYLDYSDPLYSGYLNDWGAWTAFLRCNDKNVLKEGLKWIDMLISHEKSDTAIKYIFAERDTKASLLYKIGEYEEAIRCEKEALEALQQWALSWPTDNAVIAKRAKRLTDDYTLAIKQMENREPIYVNQGALWNEETMPKQTTKKVL